jgi:hypothetical protein
MAIKQREGQCFVVVGLNITMTYHNYYSLIMVL